MKRPHRKSENTAERSSHAEPGYRRYRCNRRACIVAS
jgi:hypothetical protein